MRFQNFFKRLFGSKLTKEDVIRLLEGLLDDSFDDGEWDYFISVRLRDPSLEAVRSRMQDLWTAKSVYMIPGSISPADLNENGRKELRNIIEDLRNNKV